VRGAGCWRELDILVAELTDRGDPPSGSVSDVQDLREVGSLEALLPVYPEPHHDLVTYSTRGFIAIIARHRPAGVLFSGYDEPADWILPQ